MEWNSFDKGERKAEEVVEEERDEMKDADADCEGKSNKISPQKKSSSWEIIDAETAAMSSQQFQVFSHSPTLKFRLSWSSEPAGAMVERPR